MASMLLMAFFGKKLLPLIKFVSFFAVGFGLGVRFIHPLLADIITLEAWISGLVGGILAAIIYRFLYVVFFAGAVFFGAYAGCYAGLSETLAGFEDNKAFIFMAVAAVAVILAFILRKFVETLGMYNPSPKGKDIPFSINLERADYWLSVGAQPTDTAKALIKKARAAVQA